MFVVINQEVADKIRQIKVKFDDYKEADKYSRLVTSVFRDRVEIVQKAVNE